MAKRKSSKRTPPVGTCKIVRGRGGKRQLCYTGRGLTGWEFKRGKSR